MLYLSLEAGHLSFELREVLASFFPLVSTAIAFSFCRIGRLERSIFGIPATIQGIVGLVSPAMFFAALTKFLIMRFLGDVISFAVTCFAFGVVRGKFTFCLAPPLSPPLVASLSRFFEV